MRFLGNRLRYCINYPVYALTQGRRLRVLKNIHAGERCFIIGNGPSLKMHDLTKLSDEKKFATNMFLVHPQLEEVNLDYYCASDWVHWSQEGGFTPNLKQAFRKLPRCTFFFEYGCYPVYKRTAELQNRRVYFLFLDESHKVSVGFFRTDVEKPVYWGGSVVIDFCLPLAYYMGFENIYLIGCDYDWHGGAAQQFQSSYFYEAGKDDRELEKFGLQSYAGTPEHIAHAMGSFQVIKKYFEGSGRAIYNAGYGGKLEVFPRVNYDDLF